ncbi:MAG: hypothetical protein M9894_11545 [Planctomycetes bacterium]|nr:hypothetical protein [Planctomycetota bacterium]
MASTLLQRTLAAYASLGRYSDTGTVSWLEHGEWQRACTFTTSFTRRRRLSLRVRRHGPEAANGEGAEEAAVVALEADLSSSLPVDVTLYGRKEKQYPLQIALHACAGVTSAVSMLVPSLLLGSAPGVDWFVGLFGGAPTTRSEAGRLVVSGRRRNEPECIAALDPERLLVQSLEWSLDPALRQRLEFDVTEARRTSSGRIP